MKLLQIDSSARRNSVSRQLTEKFVHAWKKQNPAGHMVKRDLATTTQRRVIVRSIKPR